MTMKPARLALTDLWRTLAGERQMMSLIEKEILATADTFQFDKTDWVKLWYDTGHEVRSDCGTKRAYRAITLSGTLLWYVFGDGKTRGYHASASDPVAAMEEAEAAWAKRRAVKAEWAKVERIAYDLKRGKLSFDVTIEDAHRSALCTLGIEGFMASMGMARVKRLPGRIAAFLMRVEPQLGHVIYEAWCREMAPQAERISDAAQMVSPSATTDAAAHPATA